MHYENGCHKKMLSPRLDINDCESKAQFATTGQRERFLCKFTELLV